MDFKKAIFFCSIFLLSYNVSGQTISDLWLSMPTEKTAYLTSKQKSELIENYNSKIENKVINNLQGVTSIDSLSTNYGHFKLSSTKDLYLKILPYNENDNIILFIESYKSPEIHSVLKFYNLNWERISTDDKLKPLTVSDFVIHPDTLSEEEYNKLCYQISPVLFKYSFNPISDELEISLSLTLLSDDEINHLKHLIFKQKLKWNEKTFN